MGHPQTTDSLGFTLCVVADSFRALQEILRVTKLGALLVILDSYQYRDPEVQKWQELIADAVSQHGFPTGKIKWNALMDYDRLIYHSNLPTQALQNDCIESQSPFSCGCKLLKNLKGQS